MPIRRPFPAAALLVATGAAVLGSPGSALALPADGTSPVTTDSVPASWQPGAIEVTLTAADEDGGSGIATTTYEIQWANLSWSTTQTYDPANKPSLAIGERIRYRSIDVAGNVETDKVSAVARVDGAVPAPPTLGEIQTGSSAARRTVTFATAAPEATFSCSVDDGPAQACTSPLETPELAAGSHSVKVWVVSRSQITGNPSVATFDVAAPSPAPSPVPSSSPQPTPLTEPSPTPEPRVSPEAPPRAAPQSLPGPTTSGLALEHWERGEQSPLTKRSIALLVSCGADPCTVKATTKLTVGGRSAGRLPVRRVTVQPGGTQTLRIPVGARKRAQLERLAALRGPDAMAQVTLVARTPDGARTKLETQIALAGLPDAAPSTQR